MNAALPPTSRNPPPGWRIALLPLGVTALIQPVVTRINVCLPRKLMREKFLIAIVATVLLAFGSNAVAAEKKDAKAASEKKDAKVQLGELVEKIQAKLKDGKTSESDLTAELKEFDKLLAEHKDEKTDDVAQILFMKAMLYLQVFDNTEKGIELVKQIKKDFPETKPGKQSDEIIASVQKQAEAKKRAEEADKLLAVGNTFPDFNEKDVTGKPLSIANYKGKVVLIDFWATWCGPCIAELPNVLKAYKEYHSKGFEIIGISLDKDEEALTSFTKKREMPWQQYFDGKFWENKLAVQYGIQSIPATFLLDKQGKIVAKGLRGDALSAEVAKLISKP
jgi:peroxiredoxin